MILCRRPIVLLILLNILFINSILFAAGQTKILVVSSFHSGHKWTAEVREQIDKAFVLNVNPLVVDYLELNSVRNRTGNYEEKFTAYLPRLQRGDYSMVVALLDDAVTLLMNHYNELPADLPIVVCYHADVPADFQQQYPNITGIINPFPVQKIIDIAAEILPDAAEVAVISDSFPSGEQINNAIKNGKLVWPGKQIISINDREYSTDEMLKKVRALPEHSVVIFTPWRNFLRDGYAAMESVGIELSNNGKLPYLVVTDTLFGFGALAGVVEPGSETGDKLAMIMDEVLSGTPPEQVPISDFPTQVMTDMAEITNHDISLSSFPAGTRLYNNQKWPDGYNSRLLWLLAGVVIIITGAAMWYLLERKRRNKMIEKAALTLKSLSGRYEKSMDILGKTLNGTIIITDENGAIKQICGNAVKLFGLTEPNNFCGMQINQTLNCHEKTESDLILALIKQVHKTGAAQTLPGKISSIDAAGNKHLLKAEAQLLTPAEVMLIFFEAGENEKKSFLIHRLAAVKQLTDKIVDLGYMEIDDEGILLADSFSAKTKLNVERGKIVDFNQIFHGKNLIRFNCSWSALLSGKVDFIDMKGLNSGTETYDFRAEPLYNSVTEKKSYLCVIHNVTSCINWAERANKTDAVLNKLLDLLPWYVIIKEYGTDGKILAVNKAFCQYADRPELELLNRPLSCCLPPETVNTLVDADDALQTPGAIIKRTENVTGINGVPAIWQIISGCLPLKTDTQNQILIIQNVEALEEYRSRSEDLAELLEKIFDSLPLGSFLKDADNEFRYLFWNTEMTNIFSLKRENMLVHNDNEIDTLRAKAAEFLRQDQTAMQNDLPHCFSAELINAAGDKSVWNICKRSITLNSGKRYLLGTLLNMSTQLGLENQLRKTVEEQTELLKNEQIYNRCLHYISMEPDLVTAVNKSLPEIGLACHADRCFLMCMKPKFDFADANFEWTAPEIDSQADIWVKMDKMQMGIISDKLCKNEAFIVHDVVNDPQLTAIFNQCCGKRNDVKSLLLQPIFEDGVFWGVLGFVRVKQAGEITKFEQDLIYNCSNLFLLALRHYRQQLRMDDLIYMRNMIFENIRVPIILFDNKQNLIYANSAAGQMAQMRVEDIAKKKCYECFCLESGVPDYCPCKNTLKTGKSSSVVLTLHGRISRMISDAVLDEHGEIKYILESGADITEIKENNRKLREAMELAQASDRAKSDFISTMNHELRTPLNAVVGFSELLMQSNVDLEEQQDYLAAIHYSGISLLQLVNDILDLSKTSSEELQLRVRRNGIGELLGDLLKSTRRKCAEKKLEFVVDFESDLPTVYIDDKRFVQIIENLLDNALKFTEHGKIEISVSFSYITEQSGTLKIAVKDTGIGIKPEFLPKVFEPFTRDEEVSGSKAYQGSGLGLSITKHLVQALRGEILVDSRENEGSCFTIIFAGIKYER